jgi:hypothetical protein
MVWSNGAYMISSGVKWADIPCIWNAHGDTEQQSLWYDLYSPDSGTGDICKHICEINGGYLHGKKWRRPTRGELGAPAKTHPNWNVNSGDARDDGLGPAWLSFDDGENISKFRRSEGTLVDIGGPRAPYYDANLVMSHDATGGTGGTGQQYVKMHDYTIDGDGRMNFDFGTYRIQVVGIQNAYPVRCIHE